MSNPISERIAELLAKTGKNQSELARAVGVSPQAVQQWISGVSSPRGKNLRMAAEFLGVSPATLQFGAQGDALIRSVDDLVQAKVNEPAISEFGPGIQTPLRPVRAIDNPDEIEHDILQVPRYTLRASAGVGEMVLDIDQKGEPNYARRSWARRRGLDPDNLFSIVAVGDSMEPEIHDGDSLIVHRQPTIDDNKLMVICYMGECYVKRVLRQFDGSLIIKSTNPQYHDVVIPKVQASELIVVGRVVSITHNA